MKRDGYMMTFEDQKEKSLAMLSQRGLTPSISAPLLFRLLWAIGIKLPPPHFMGFATLSVIWGVWFAVAWGAIMRMAVWSRQDLTMLQAAGSAVAVGALFGLSLGAVYARGRKKYGLPTWASFLSGRND